MKQIVLIDTNVDFSGILSLDDGRSVNVSKTVVKESCYETNSDHLMVTNEHSSVGNEIM